MKTAREEILAKLKDAVHTPPVKPDFDAPVYLPIDKPLEVAFRENLEKVNGSVHLFESKEDLFRALKEFLTDFDPGKVFCREKEIGKYLEPEFTVTCDKIDLPESIEAGITGCEYLIAHTGTVMVSSAQKGGRQMFVYPPVHIVVAAKSQIVDYLDTAYSKIVKKYKGDLPSQITLITGPSRTADIEKTLILGAHGPKALHVFIA